MKKIQVENITDAMVLAKDVTGPSGNVLLSVGTKISPSIGRRLKNWGVFFVNVQGDDVPADGDGVAHVSDEEIRAALGRRFSEVMGNELMKKIFDAVLSYKIQKGAR
jgi:hypothetical protein